MFKYLIRIYGSVYSQRTIPKAKDRQNYLSGYTWDILFIHIANCVAGAGLFDCSLYRKFQYFLGIIFCIPAYLSHGFDNKNRIQNNNSQADCSNSLLKIFTL